MDRTIYKEICPDCKGFGHVPDCKCRDPVAFIMGCCERCGGEGYIPAKPPEDPDEINGRR